MNDQTVDSDGVLHTSSQLMNIDSATRLLLSQLLQLPRQPAVLLLEAVRGAFSQDASWNEKEVNKACPLALPHHAFGSEGQYKWCSHWWSVPTLRKPAVEELGVPVISCEPTVP